MKRFWRYLVDHGIEVALIAYASLIAIEILVFVFTGSLPFFLVALEESVMLIHAIREASREADMVVAAPNRWLSRLERSDA